MDDTRPVITRTDGMWSMSCKVAVAIHAEPGRVWALLTDAAGYPRWNSTILRIEGRIREGERLRLHVPGTRRTFTPRVGHVSDGRGMTWSDGIAAVFKGVRTFTLVAHADGRTAFTMEEHFSGIVFALAKRFMPDFGPIFERFAADLKREAERAGGSGV